MHDRAYPVVAPTGLGLLLWLGLPLLFAALLIGGMTLHSAHRGASGVHIGLLMLIAVVCGASWARRQVLLRGDRLEVRAGFLRRRVAVAAMRLEGARVIDLGERIEFKPGRKLFGFGYPGFHAGYFRTRGGHKAFCLLTAERALAIPLHDGRWLLLSVEQPRRLLEDLHATAALQVPVAAVAGRVQHRH
ncbi:hypothetical protein CKY51_17255 [Xanthomonas maliensis]|nr:hypothetical protein CKY51_17255 [Xanthomonas maliensis]